jgi:hypothetical protein
VVDVQRLVIGLLAYAGQPRGVAHAGAGGVHMEVAAHEKRVGQGYEQSVKEAKNVCERTDETH